MARHRRRPRDSRTEQGVAALEFALVLPLLLALLFGIITAGLAYNDVLGVSGAVHEGARFGATMENTAAWGPTVQQQTIALAAVNVSTNTVITPAMVCAQLVKTPATIVQASSCSLPDPTPINLPGIPAGTCVVKVWAQIPVDLNFVIIPKLTRQVKRQSVSLYERPCS